MGLLAGCSRDPNVQKQEYVESGERYFQAGKYREAAIQFQNALRVDSHYADAHYQLAQCYRKLELWQSAYAELGHTLDSDPKNWQAHLDMGNLDLAGGGYIKAEGEARTVGPENVM